MTLQKQGKKIVQLAKKLATEIAKHEKAEKSMYKMAEKKKKPTKLKK